MLTELNAKGKYSLVFLFNVYSFGQRYQTKYYFKNHNFYVLMFMPEKFENHFLL